MSDNERSSELVKRLRGESANGRAALKSVPDTGLPDMDVFKSAITEIFSLLDAAADALSEQAKSPPVAVAAELPDKPPQFYAVKWHCGGEMFYAGNMLVVEKDRYNALRTAAEQIIAAKEGEIARLTAENQEYNGDVAEATAHYKFELKRAESAEARLAVVEAALETDYMYSDHTYSCAFRDDNDAECTCGYDRAAALYRKAMFPDEALKEPTK